MLKKLFLKWWKWVNYIEETPVEVPLSVAMIEPPVPIKDRWQRLFAQANACKYLLIKPMNITWYDRKLSMYSDNYSGLYARLDLIAYCISRNVDPPALWEERRKEVEVISMPDYLFDEITSYASPQKVLDTVVEKVLVIHNLLEPMKLNAIDPYRVFLVRTFHSVIADAEVLLTHLQAEEVLLAVEE